MSDKMILLGLIILPAAAAVPALFCMRRKSFFNSLLLFLAAAGNLALAASLLGKNMAVSYPWLPWFGSGIDFALKADSLSSFIVFAAAAFAFLVSVYSLAFLKGKRYGGGFIFYLLITMALVNGAVLANDLVVMLFFWEGLLITLFGMILLSGRKKFPTAVKALTLNGIADLCLLLGVAITGWVAGTFNMDGVQNLNIENMAVLGFVMMMLGAIGKAGSMPFHSWIPDAAEDAPLPFMAILPAALEKLLGIYLLARITLELYNLQPHTSMSTLLLTIGAVTIVLAVSMALIQKDFKRLLSYHAISQVGYMILGIGTALPIGIVGGLFHMLNHAVYKSCLFLTGGAVERQAGTTDLKKLGGLGKYMPVTTVCFLIAAASISGLPPFNGFFSKELIFDAAWESGMIFYVAAALGAFLTAASFLKLGHVAFFGKPSSGELKKTKEAPWPMLLPMLVLAGACVLFGVGNALPLKAWIQPAVAAGQDFSGLLPQNSHSWLLVGISLGVLLLAVINHRVGVKLSGSSLGASDHIRHAPLLRSVYHLAERRFFDPYEIFIFTAKIFARLAYGIDRAINWVYDVFFVRLGALIARALKRAALGTQTSNIVWSLIGLVVIISLFIILV
ncbi:MAG: hypothetical protein FWD39_06275 [Clostridiales bacterium]|nr:hypothetical protein [Clostridiales bacterium]